MATHVNYIPKPDIAKVPSSARSPLREDKFNRDGKQPILAYPSDVGLNQRQASYILFARHAITGAKVKPLIKPVNAATAGVAAGLSLKQIAAQQKVYNAQAEQANATRGGSGGAGKGGTSNSLVLSRRNIVRTGVHIALYMPPSINVKYQMDYSQGEIGVMGEALYGLFKDYQSGQLLTDDSWNRASGTFGTGLQQMGIGLVNKVIPGAKDLYAIERGAIITPRTEMMFRGIGRRDFSFTFTFIPKDATESETVRKIVKEFKTGMSPEFKIAGSVRELTIPDVFSIQYMHMNGPNSYLNKIGKCYLKTMDVTYGGDKFVTYNADAEGAPPQRTIINMAFQELEILDRANVEDGY
jgi:hypothetical protein